MPAPSRPFWWQSPSPRPSECKGGRQFGRCARRRLSWITIIFSACARIYGYSASSLSFAFYNGNLQSRFPYSEQLKELRPENDFWLNIFTSDKPSGELRDWSGARRLPEVLSGYPCAMLRGSRSGALAAFLAAEAPEAVYDTSCSTRQEDVFTMGVDCRAA